MRKPLVVITGASAGIGFAAARGFAAAGHPLLWIARHITPLAELTGRAVDNAPLDVADFAALQRAVLDAEAQLPAPLCIRELVVAPTRTTF